MAITGTVSMTVTVRIRLGLRPDSPEQLSVRPVPAGGRAVGGPVVSRAVTARTRRDSVRLSEPGPKPQPGWPPRRPRPGAASARARTAVEASGPGAGGLRARRRRRRRRRHWHRGRCQALSHRDCDGTEPPGGRTVTAPAPAGGNESPAP